MSIAYACAAAVRDKIAAIRSGPDLSPPAVRTMVRKDATALEKEQIDIIPATQGRELVDRNSIAKTQIILVAVSKSISFDDDEDDVNQDEAAAIVASAEDLADKLQSIEHRSIVVLGKKAQITSAQIGGDIDPVLDVDLLETHNLARCVVQVIVRIS